MQDTRRRLKLESMWEPKSTRSTMFAVAVSRLGLLAWPVLSGLMRMFGRKTRKSPITKNINKTFFIVIKTQVLLEDVRRPRGISY